MCGFYASIYNVRQIFVIKELCKQESMPYDHLSILMEENTLLEEAFNKFWIEMSDMPKDMINQNFSSCLQSINMNIFTMLEWEYLTCIFLILTKTIQMYSLAILRKFSLKKIKYRTYVWFSNTISSVIPWITILVQ